MTKTLVLSRPENMWAIVRQSGKSAKIIAGTTSYTREAATQSFAKDAGEPWSNLSVQNGGCYDCVKVTVGPRQRKPQGEGGGHLREVRRRRLALVE